MDQFYTKTEIAREYARQVSDRWSCPDTLFVEPSAGTGAFVEPLLESGRKVRAMDIEPFLRSDILKGDFLELHQMFSGSHSATVVVGNPPFGKNASLAVRFFNRAALHADAIAFILPRTFRKISIHKRLDRRFHMKTDGDVVDNAFLFEGQEHDVPCTWQVWERSDMPRIAPVPPCVDHLIEYTTPEHASFAMRRVGFYAGRVIVDNLHTLSGTTHYFMRETMAGVADVLRNVQWTELVAQTAGVRSLSKSEIAFKLGEIYDA